MWKIIGSLDGAEPQIIVTVKAKNELEMDYITSGYQNTFGSRWRLWYERVKDTSSRFQSV